MSEGRTPASIEADIIRKRQELAVVLDEIAVRVHPKTILQDAKDKASAGVDRTLGRVRSQVVAEDGSPRMSRVVPIALVTVVVVGGVVLARRRR
ncbi:DUF3618 domain-containing protein [Streptomyces sp. NPDC005438]|uniref:DUF3618 domain-containing protein n=1 Tax=Streptomyces sp. NPDC005438 TaxID=3156880 RepID=UPI0033A585DB